MPDELRNAACRVKHEVFPRQPNWEGAWVLNPTWMWDLLGKAELDFSAEDLEVILICAEPHINEFIETLLHEKDEEIAELKEDVAEGETSYTSILKNIVELTPFDLPAAHHRVEYLHEWRKRWDELVVQLASARDSAARLERNLARIMEPKGE